MGTDGADAGTTTEEAIMRATHRALCEHGFAELTMQSIADEFEKSKAVLHYHYDTKQQLLIAFLEHLLARFERDAAVDADGSADERLLALTDDLLGEGDREHRGGVDHRELTTVLLQIRAQAPYDEEFRRQLTINAATVRDLLAAVIADGVERGVFRDVDPERTALTLLVCTTGARDYEAALDLDGVERDVRETLRDLVREWLVRPEAG
jgi:AcrR family transcriptional regulator